jgi:hypothetical protein
MRALLTRVESWISLTQPTRPRSRSRVRGRSRSEMGRARLADAARVWLCLRPPWSPAEPLRGPHVVVGSALDGRHRAPDLPALVTWPAINASCAVCGGSEATRRPRARPWPRRAARNAPREAGG